MTKTAGPNLAPIKIRTKVMKTSNRLKLCQTPSRKNTSKLTHEVARVMKDREGGKPSLFLSTKISSWMVMMTTIEPCLSTLITRMAQIRPKWTHTNHKVRNMRLNPIIGWILDNQGGFKNIKSNTINRQRDPRTRVKANRSHQEEVEEAAKR